LYAGALDPNDAKHNTEDYSDGKKQITLKTAIGTMGTGWMNAGLAKDNAEVTYANASNTTTNPNGCIIKVKRNGVPLEWAGNYDKPDTFTFSNNGAGIITFRDAIQVGDVYEVTLKTGDAPEETISIKVVNP
jgi:hypothetical protein